MRRIPFHPLLFAAFPVLFLFERNVDVIGPRKVVLPLLGMIAIVAVATVVLSVAFRDRRRGAIAASGLAILALSYGHVWSSIRDKSLFGIVIGRDMFLLPVWIVLIALWLLFAWRIRALKEVTSILTFVGIGMVAISLLGAGTALARQGSQKEARKGAESRDVPKARAKTQRDIVYLVPEDYGGAGPLKEHNGVDELPFYDALTQRGFYVARDAKSNYPHTLQSLASTMNLEYLDRFARDPGPPSTDEKPIASTLVGSKIARFLQGQGYHYSHIGGWWDPTANDDTADFNYHLDRRSEFTRVLIRTSILQPLAKRFGPLKELDGRLAAYKQVFFQFDSIAKAVREPGPNFVFAHVMIPHEPVVVDARGRYVTEEQQNAKPFNEGYAGQVEFLHKEIVQLVDRLLSVPEARRPIVLIQSDEGVKDLAWPYPEKLSWAKASDKLLKIKFPILSAYYLPGTGNAGLYPSISPVNSFRLILNNYFKTDLRMLPDEYYAVGSGEDTYRFVRVTDRLKRK